MIDDLHSADAQSLRMLCYLLRRLEGSGIAVLLAARPGEPVGTEVQAMLARIAVDRPWPLTPCTPWRPRPSPG